MKCYLNTIKKCANVDLIDNGLTGTSVCTKIFPT